MGNFDDWRDQSQLNCSTLTTAIQVQSLEAQFFEQLDLDNMELPLKAK